MKYAMNKNLTHLLLLLLLCCSVSTTRINAQDSPFPDDSPAVVELGEQEEKRDAFKQNIMIAARFAGWEEASANFNQRVNDTLRGNWIMVDSNGRFEGKVVPAEGAGVERMNIFLMNRGRLVKQTSLDANGRFVFNNVRQGAYSLIGWGDKGFFAFGMNILANNPRAKNSILNEIKVTAFQNVTSINTDWIKHFAANVNYRVYGRYPDGEGADDPAPLYGFLGLASHTPKSTAATSISSHNVSTTGDGRLIGRVHQLNSLSGRPVDVRTTKVMLFEKDSVVASTTTDNFGVFEFQKVPNGSYGVAAVGVDGVGLIAINVGGSGAPAMNDQGEFIGGEYPIDFTMVSSETVGWLNHYANEVSYRRALLAPRPPARQAAAPAPYFGNGACPTCNNSPGGCSTCQQAYLLSLCRSRGLTFEQWQTHCQGRSLPGQPNLRNLGDGQIISRAAERIRKNSDRLDRAFENAFYPDNTNAVLQQLQQSQQQPAFPAQQFQQPIQAPAFQQQPPLQQPQIQAPAIQQPPIIQGAIQPAPVIQQQAPIQSLPFDSTPVPVIPNPTTNSILESAQNNLPPIVRPQSTLSSDIAPTIDSSF